MGIQDHFSLKTVRLFLDETVSSNFKFLMYKHKTKHTLKVFNTKAVDFKYRYSKRVLKIRRTNIFTRST